MRGRKPTTGVSPIMATGLVKIPFACSLSKYDGFSETFRSSKGISRSCSQLFSRSQSTHPLEV